MSRIRVSLCCSTRTMSLSVRSSMFSPSAPVEDDGRVRRERVQVSHSGPKPVVRDGLLRGRGVLTPHVRRPDVLQGLAGERTERVGHVLGAVDAERRAILVLLHGMLVVGVVLVVVHELTLVQLAGQVPGGQT